jgi:1-acyl-sn-glycerol-3-phosphate acyltransferase
MEALSALGLSGACQTQRLSYGGAMIEKTYFYRGLRLLSVLPRAYFHLRVEGAVRVPAAGPCIIAANHTSYVDPIVLWMACPRHVSFIVDREQYRRPLVNWVAARTGAIPVENNPRDLGSLRRALLALRQGAVLGIFPEGGRSEDGRLKAGKPGAVLLALRAGVPLLPAGIVGAFAAYSRHHLLPRPKPILVRFGEPLELPEAWRGHAAKDHLEEATSLLMERIRILSDLPH